MNNNYFFVDGSALLGDIQRVRDAMEIPTPLRFDLLQLVHYFAGVHYAPFHQYGYKRFVFYFVESDKRIRDNVILPDTTVPGAISDVRIEYCGKRIAQFAKAHQWLEDNKAPSYVRDCAYRSEKAVDTKICCDALQLAGINKLDRLFLYTNDYDFVPLFRALRAMGANINIFRIQAKGLNKELAAQCDALHEMPVDILLAAFKENS